MDESHECSVLANVNENSVCSPRLWADLKKVADSAHVRKIPDGADRPLCASDFKDISFHVEKSLVCLQEKLHRLVDSDSVQHLMKLDTDVRSFLVSSLIVCGEQSSDDIWTTSNSVLAAGDIFNVLCVIFRMNAQNLFGEVNSRWKVDMCRLMLMELKPKLRKTNWKQYPASFTCYRWILSKAEAPQISENFKEFLHSALIAVDDHEISNQVKGVSCLSLIISNVTRTDLCHLGYDDVIYSALEHLLYSKEPDITLWVVPCLSHFLQKVEKGYTYNADTLQFTRYDKSLKIFLGNMEMEQYLARRKAYVEVLPLLLDSMGLPMVRWSKRLLRIFEDYLLVDDGSKGVSTMKTLEAVKVYILHTWPMVPKNMSGLLEALLKLLIEITDLDPSREISPETSEAILQQIEDCLNLIMKTSSPRAKELCAGVDLLCVNSKFDEIVKRVFMPS